MIAEITANDRGGSLAVISALASLLSAALRKRNSVKGRFQVGFDSAQSPT